MFLYRYINGASLVIKIIIRNSPRRMKWDFPGDWSRVTSLVRSQTQLNVTLFNFEGPTKSRDQLIPINMSHYLNLYYVGVLLFCFSLVFNGLT